MKGDTLHFSDLQNRTTTPPHQLKNNVRDDKSNKEKWDDLTFAKCNG